jgi:nitrite reductase/ring-hydroxylating ferredoxin subunit
MFSIEDGSVQGGPASSPLSEVAITVDGDSIVLA